MDPYSCNLKDIMSIKNIKKEKNEEESIKVEEVENNKIGKLEKSEKSEKSESLTDNLYSNLKDKITKPKSIKIILLTLLVFLFLTSEVYITFIKNYFPAIISSENSLNSNGKIISALILSLIVIFFT